MKGVMKRNDKCAVKTAEDVLVAMQTLENPKQREVLMRFFKTGKGEYGEGDKFFGLAVPETRAIAKAAKDLPLEEVQILLESPWHEMRLCGFLILVAQFERAEKGIAKGKRKEEYVAMCDGIVDFYLNNAQRANNWDLVDLSCYKVLGAWMLLPSCKSYEEKLTILDRLSASENLWERRISMVSTFAALKKGDWSLTWKYASYHIEAFCSDPSRSHDLMHKAVGWMLREMGKRCGMEVLRDFLAKYSKAMPRTALRYAIELMSAEEKLYWMGK